MKTYANQKYRNGAGKILPVFILCFAALLAVLGAGFSGEAYGAEKAGNGAQTAVQNPDAKLGLLVTGPNVRGSAGFQKDIIRLTEEEMAQLQTEKKPEVFGLGASWKEKQRYSAYDNHGTGTFHYSLADGLDINTLLDAAVKGGIDAVDSYWIWSQDTYSNKMHLAHTKELKYFPPGKGEGIPAAGPMLALYRNISETSDRENGREPDEAEPLAKLDSGVFVYGQNDPTTDNNCHYIKKVNALYVGDPVTLVKTDNDRFTFKRLKDLMELGIFHQSCRFSEEGKVTEAELEGVPLPNVLETMGLQKYLPAYAENHIELVSEDGSRKQIAKEDLERCFLAWSFTDDDSALQKQTGQLAVFVRNETENDTQSDTVVYNLSKINAVDKNGEILLTVPQKPSPAAPTVVKAERKSYSSIRLTWKKNSKADGYNIYRYSAAAKEYRKIKTLPASGASFTDSGLSVNTTYKYRIKSFVKVNQTSYEGAYSAAVSAKPTLDRGAITKLSKVKNNGVRITWKKAAGADGYQLYRAVKKSGKYTKIATVKKGTSLSLTDKKTKKGTSYYYKVRPYRMAGKAYRYGEFSAVKGIKR